MPIIDIRFSHNHCLSYLIHLPGVRNTAILCVPISGHSYIQNGSHSPFAVQLKTNASTKPSVLSLFSVWMLPVNTFNNC